MLQQGQLLPYQLRHDRGQRLLFRLVPFHGRQELRLCQLEHRFRVQQVQPFHDLLALLLCQVVLLFLVQVVHPLLCLLEL